MVDELKRANLLQEILEFVSILALNFKGLELGYHPIFAGNQGTSHDAVYYELHTWSILGGKTRKIFFLQKSLEFEFHHPR